MTQRTQTLQQLLLVVFTAGTAVAGERRIWVSIPDRKLTLLEDGRVVRVYDIAVGAATTPSPRGEFRIVNRIAHPTWYYGGKVVPPGKQNPLGTRWMGLSAAGYGIHGTNAPASIGTAASHGCIRMRNADAEELFRLVEEGMKVELSGEKVEALTRTMVAAE